MGEKGKRLERTATTVNRGRGCNVVAVSAKERFLLKYVNVNA